MIAAEAQDARLNAEMAEQESSHRVALCARDGHDWGIRVLILDGPYPAGHGCRRCRALAR